jgi:hypothetical protein
MTSISTTPPRQHHEHGDTTAGASSKSAGPQAVQGRTDSVLPEAATQESSLSKQSSLGNEEHRASVGRRILSAVKGMANYINESSGYDAFRVFATRVAIGNGSENPALSSRSKTASKEEAQEKPPKQDKPEDKQPNNSSSGQDQVTNAQRATEEKELQKRMAESSAPESR